MTLSIDHQYTPLHLLTQAMNQQQLDAAHTLILLMDGDEVAQADASAFGDWYSNLTDHLLDALDDTSG